MATTRTPPQPAPQTFRATVTAGQPQSHQDVSRQPAPQTFRATVTGRHTIALPAYLRRMLDIAPGDAVEFVVEGRQATLRKAPPTPEPGLRGLLADYFTDREDVQRFLDEERSGWGA